MRATQRTPRIRTAARLLGALLLLALGASACVTDNERAPPPSEPKGTTPTKPYNNGGLPPVPPST